jgi:hypothetical protein
MPIPLLSANFKAPGLFLVGNSLRSSMFDVLAMLGPATQTIFV